MKVVDLAQFVGGFMLSKQLSLRELLVLLDPAFS